MSKVNKYILYGIFFPKNDNIARENGNSSLRGHYGKSRLPKNQLERVKYLCHIVVYFEWKLQKCLTGALVKPPSLPFPIDSSL